jgi:type II secretory ATPase GspE/PulE/Tfp pilus assembly ATPase PilB-like protein
VNFSDGERLAIASTLIDSLRCIVNQELAPKLCQKCSVPLEYLDPILENSGLDQTLARKPAGCEACDGSGFNGRYALLEYLVLSNEARTELLKALITEGLGGITLLMQNLVEKFGQTKLQAARVGFESGMITEEVFRSIYVEYQTMELLNSHG